MIDYSKFSDPDPVSSGTTAPVAPASPGSLAPPAAPSGGIRGLTGLPSSTPASPAEEPALDPGQQIAKGIDDLGQTFFGRGNGSPLGGIPLLGDAVGGVGNVVHGFMNYNVVKPIEGIATVASHIPLGWVPGGADQTFAQIGEQLKNTTDPLYAQAYQQWKIVKAASDGDVLGGGNMKGDFNTEFMKMQDDRQHDSILGTTPDLAIGSSGVGSFGGAVSLAIRGFLGVGANDVQGFLGGLGFFNPDSTTSSYDQMRAKYDHPNAYISDVTDAARYAFQQVDKGVFTDQQARDYVAKAGGHLSRAEEALGRMQRGGEVSDVEKNAIEMWQSGAWSLQHANDSIVAKGQSITRNPVGQVLGSVVTDPLTYATIGAGGISSLGEEGVKIAETAGTALNATRGLGVGEKLAAQGANASALFDAAKSADSAYAKLALTVASVQKSQMGIAFRISRGLFDPLSVYKPGTVARATQDLMSATSLSGLERGVGRLTVRDGRALSREVGMDTEFDSAMASYAMDKGMELVTMKANERLLKAGLGEEMLQHQFVPDDIAEMLSRNAAADGETEMADYVQRIAKNTFTPEEEKQLPARLAATYGKDEAYWAAKMKGASVDLKSFMHAMTYKTSEAGFERAKSLVDSNVYAGSGPLKNLVLMSSETMDDETAKAVSASIKDALAQEQNGIATGTKLWNDQARRYPALSNIGWAPGGKEQLDNLVKELDRRVEAGGITKRLPEPELSHPALKPVRDWLDRNTMAAPARTGADGTIEAKMAAGDVAGSQADNVAEAAAKGGNKAGGALKASPEDEYKIAKATHEQNIADYKAAKAKYDEDLAKYQTEKAQYDTEQQAYEDALQKNEDALNSDSVPEDVAAVTKKWTEDRPSTGQPPKKDPTRLRADLEKLADKGYDVSQADSYLDDYTNIERDGMSMEDYAAEKQDAWDQIMEELNATAPVDGELPDEPIPPTEPTPPPLVKTTAPEPPQAADVTATATPTIETPSVVVNGRQHLWRVGFRPDEEVAWGVKRSPETGDVIFDRAPTISHIVDAVPGRQHFSDTTRNVLGQIIGKSGAERLNKPIDSVEAYLNTLRDGITGQRLVNNIDRRFERSTFDIGIPKSLSNAIMDKAKDVAGLNSTTIRGISPSNLWNEVHAMIPNDLVLTGGAHAGERLNIHIVMDHLLQASEGDLRIMGLTSQFSQRVRTWLHAHGDASNWIGQMTVTMYNKLRYSQPLFLIQRITDAPYYSILYGVTPVGKAILHGSKGELQAILDNMGRTGLARHFSMDMPEYATRSNFTKGIKNAMQEAGLKDHVLDRIHSAPDAVIANNMTNMMHARLGEIVKGVIDNIGVAAEHADPEYAAEMLRAGDDLRRSFGDWRMIYSEQAGRQLSDEEVGLRYLQDQLNAWRRHVVRADGTLDFKGLIQEGQRWTPSDIGKIESISPDDLAREIGSKYADRHALRADVNGVAKKVNGTFQLVKGEHDLPWLEEQLRDVLHAHPDYVKRAMAYFSGDWDSFWYNLSRPIESGGLDISTHYAKEAQNVIAGMARERGMDPWEYLSGVMGTNIGPKDLSTEMGRFVAFLKGGPVNAKDGDWGAFIQSHLDPSAQQTLVKEFGGAAAPRDVPAGFTTNQHVAASGTVSTLPRDGLFHVTTAKDAVMKDGFKTGSEVEGFGSKGDTSAAGRVSILTNRARATTYAERIQLAGKAARGEVTREQIADYFRPLYEKAYPGEADQIMSNAAGSVTMGAAVTPEELYGMVRHLDGALIGSRGTLGEENGAVNLVAPFASAQKWDPNQIAMLELATKDRAEVKTGLDAGELTLKPEDLHPLGTASTDTSDMFEKNLITMLQDRVKSGKAHPNEDVEGILQQVSKMVQATLKGTPAEGETRSQLRSLVEAIPTSQAAPYNRSHALVISLLHDKIEQAQADVFRLAEMQTKRTVLERSLNHPLFGLYPASYMWSKVLPETVKFLARNPYAATYVIADVQRAIALQREYDPNFEDKMSSMDRSAGAFLADYLTPGLPWSDHSARMSPMVRDIFKGQFGNIWPDEIATVSPDRWVKQISRSIGEVPGAIDSLSAPPPESGPVSQIKGLATGADTAPTTPAPHPTQITGTVPASGLQPILQDDLARLQSIFLGGSQAAQ